MSRRLIGSHAGDTRLDIDIPRYFELYRGGKLELDELITDRCALDDINGAVDLVKGGAARGRCLIHTDHQH